MVTLAVITVIVVILLARPITTAIHELGHAIPALLFTRDTVTIYIGSYGDIDKSITFTIGRLKTIFRYKITQWQLGLCSHKAPPYLWQNILIVLGGPVLSLILGLICLYYAQYYKEEPFVAMLIVIFLVSGISDFIVNIIPNDNPLELHDGAYVMNDGSQLLEMIKIASYPASFSEGLKLLDANKKEAGIQKIKETIDAGHHSTYLYGLVIEQLIDTPEAAIKFYSEYGNRFKLQAPDFEQVGDLYKKLDEPTIAIQYYGQAIQINYLSANALYKRAKLFHQLGYDQKASDDLKKVILMTENPDAKALLEQLK